MTFLLDSNVLIAAALEGHAQHEIANLWLEREVKGFATCAVTEGALLRVHMQMAKVKTSKAAWATLAAIRAHPLHEFWDDGFSYSVVRFRSVKGHKQITDAWLAETARRRNGRLATFDRGLIATHTDVAVLVAV